MSRKQAAKKPAGAEGAGKAVEELHTIATEIYNELLDGQVPKMTLPLRTKANIRFDPRASVWKYGSLKGVRSAKKLKRSSRSACGRTSSSGPRSPALP